MKNNKKFVALLMAMMMMMSMAACGGAEAPAEETADAPAATEQTEEAPAEEAPAEEAPAAEGETSGEAATSAPAEFDGKIHGPFLMTTCGQSTGSVMLHMVAGQIGATSTDDHSLAADAVASSGAKTLVITTGTSGKGMGAAGTDVNDEIERCTAVAEAAKEAGMTIVVAHVEGMARRTDSADQSSIDSMLPFADVIMVVEESDSDKLFSNYASENNIPIVIAKDALGLGEFMAAE